jgi:hypothetical protein
MKAEVQYERTRVHHPFHDLLGAAYAGLTLAKEGKRQVPQNTLTAILFSALAIEGLANSFGEVLVQDWKDYEFSGTLAKLRTLADCDGLENILSDSEWAAMRGLFKFRNKIAHPRKEKIVLKGSTTLDDYEENMKYSPPKSKWDRMVTLNNAQMYVDLAHDLHERLSEQLFTHKRLDPNHHEYDHSLVFLIGDGWHGEGSIQ